ncbi:hypothetical protein NQ314_010910 [Rhamnusium bicolor]|uniref:Protein AF-10 n=1 Tax=Rhamnusium bicolor TaxID=1586634 RepID=A0AAV8XN98_9CUCU|nr:hypothetical protein NQ314_010910 [Rhamnusium bicolor]
MREMVGGCCVCSDDRGWSENPLVYCDGQSCTVAVHQACYGIVTVPTGPWYCRKCESQERSVKVKCELCPSKYGALKRTDNSGWAHVVCALYIPEVRFGNVTTMEPIQLQLIPAERFNKVCYICEEKGKASSSTVGACMQCNKAGCRQQFHVTCAQGLGLLCEEAGNYLDNVKYCGYCQHHYSKLSPLSKKKGGNVKTIPPYKPVSNEAHNSDSNSEKETEAVLANTKSNISPPTSSKRKSSVGSKSAPAKTSTKSSSSSQQKTVHNHNKNSDKSKVSNSKSAKSDDSANTDSNLDSKSDKKRLKKVSSRTPTPVSVVTSEISVVVTTVATTSTTTPTPSAISNISADKKNAAVSDNSSEKSKNKLFLDIMTGGNSNQGLLTSEMSGGGLKITYEKQVDSINTEVDMELELEPSPPAPVEVPTKRGRLRNYVFRSQSQSNEKTERSSRGKKRNSGATSVPTQLTNSNTLPKRSSRSQHVTPPPEPPGAFAAISQSQIKDSPPSSPSSESQSVPPSTSRGRTKGRKSAPAAVSTASNSSKDSKDIKLFQNGLTAPHMLGNQLNPSSNMHSKMTDHLNSELEAHSIFNPNENCSNLLGPQLHHRVIQSARASSTASSTASGGSGLSSMLGGGGGNIPQTLDQLLERQWEQGSQFLMEQAQHFDIASLLSCLHQLRAENLRLEEHVGSLLQRRDHLLAVNARLAIPLTGQPATPQSTHAHTVNNIHSSVAPSHGDVPRPSRHSGSNSGYPSHPQGTAQHPPVENGLPPDTYPQNPHRSPAGSQPSPTVRHSSAGAYPNSGLHRQNADTSGRSAPRPQPYPLYDRPGPSSQQVFPLMLYLRKWYNLLEYNA